MTSEQLSQNQRKENAPLNGMSCGAGDPAATRPLPLADSDDYDSLIAAADLDRPLSNGWKVYEHQKEAIKTCLRQRRTILAYDMVLFCR